MQKFTHFINVFFVFLTLFCINPINAQFQLPNSGFETFETGFNGEGQQPTSWKGSNVVQTVAGFTARGELVNSNNNGHTGNCVYLHNEEVGAMGITAPAPAFVALGTPWNEVSGLSSSNAIGGCTGGLAFTHHPDTLSLWIKREYRNVEYAHVMVYLWSGISQGTAYRNKGAACQNSNRTDEQVDITNTNSCTTTQSANLIGLGEWVSNQQFSGWTEIKIPITYFNNSIPEKINVIISAANYPCEGCSNSIKAESKLWADDLSLKYSSKISEIRINNRSMSGFNTNTLTYTYSLGVGVTTIPPITVHRSGRQLSGSEILITNGTVGGAPTTIRVNAEDGSSSTTYTINFVAQQSTNSRLSNIFIDGSPLANFNGYVVNYNVELPYGTTVCPTITVQKAEPEQTFTITPCTGIPGSATITVFAEDVLVSQTYTINYTVAALTDNTLQDILINGVSISGFSPTKTNYAVELPLGTTTAPTITPVSAYADGEQTIVLTNNGLSGTSTIVVSAGNSPVRTYRITFTVTASSYAYLNNIEVGGVPLANFDAETLTYNYLLPRGTTVLPAITWTLGEANQTATLTAGGVNGETRIIVQAQNGNMAIYKINFSVERSEVSTLNDILIDGQSISGFRSDSLTYTIQLPSGTTVVPAITYVLGDYAQTVRVTSGGLTSPATIRVTAENTTFSTVYTINFSVTMSANAQLASIIVDGNPLAGFLPEVFSYNYILPNNATVCPEIEVVKASVGQKIVIVKPQLAGLATIEVTPETGGESNVYTIDFIFAQSNNNLLDSIQIDNALFAEFNPVTSSYTITLSAHSEVPEIEAFASDSTSLVVIVDNGLDGCSIVVTAENGGQNIYEISYNVAPSTETGLADIQLLNSAGNQFASLSGFDADILAYNVDLAWGTAVVPVIHPVKLENAQTVSINYGKVNDTTLISVYDEALSNVRHYRIIFNVEKSSVATLNSILLDGNEISNFDPNTLSYTVVLPYGTVSSPQIGYEKAITGTDTVYNQTVKVTDGGLYQPATVEVTAEDGTTNIYTVNYQIDMSAFQNGNYLTNILMDGVPVDNFDSQTADYNIVLPYETTQLPDLAFLKNYPEQTVFADYSGINGTTTVIVKSNIESVADMVYNLHFSTSNIEKTVLTDILIDGVSLADFDPTVKTYILPITTLPVVTFSADLTKVNVTDSTNHKQAIFKVEDIEAPDSYSLYTVYFFYQNDVIPNPSFESWSNGTVNTGKQKPTSWKAPIDTENVSNTLFGTNCRGNEVTKDSQHTEGSFSAFLQGQYCSSSTQWNPGVITLGTYHTSGSIVTNHISYVDGGIDFRNTPDALLLDYKWSKGLNVSGNTNPHIAVQLWNIGDSYSSSERVTDVSYTDETQYSDWTQLALPLVYSDEDNVSPQRLNIILNASKSENTDDLYPGNTSFTQKWGIMYADNLRFEYSSKLSNIVINGDAVTDFNSNTLSYNVDISPESSGVPQIAITGQVPDQEHRIVISDEVAGQRTATITSIAEDGSQTVYTLNIARANSAVDVLTDIIINGNSIEDFRADSLDYTLTLTNGYAHLNNVTVMKGESHQSIYYQIANNQLLITVTAEDGTENIYTINLEGQQSNNSTLANIDVEGYPIGFTETTTSYQVTLPANTKDIPSISYTKQTDGQTVILSTKANNANDTVFIQVISQDRLDTTIYSIVFDTQAVVTSKLLTRISIENILLDNFDKNVFDYSIVVNGALPKLTFEREFEQDSVSSTHYADSVVFEIGNANIYKVIFVKARSNNALLNDISVNGQTVAGFDPNVFDYSVDNTGNNYLPQITVQPYENSHIAVTRSGDKAIIEVTAQGGGAATNEYSVEFVTSVPISNDSVLAGILLDGTMIAGFAPNILNYAVSLPEGTTFLPEITVIRDDNKQTVQITTNGVNGTTQIVVTSEGGSQTIYTIDFSVLLSDYALLNLILINGVEIDNFASSTLNYSYTLPYGTTALPTIEYEKGHIGQTVTTTPDGVNGNYIITVTSESGNVTNNYIIGFSVEPSNNSALAGITVNDENITGFDAQIFEYKVILPYGTTQVPVINYVAGDSVQNIVVTQANTLSDTAIIVVAAENGINRTTYRVSFEINLSDNAYLADILIGGEPLRTIATGFVADINFNSEEFYYNVTLPYGTTSIPEIEWVGQIADYNTIQYFEGNLDDLSSRILVVSQDLSNTNEYFITFVVAKSNNSRLNDILVNGVSIDGFNSDTLAYHIKYPVGTSYDQLATAEDITYILGEEHQTVVKTRTSDNTIIITVTAQDGVSQSVYVITQEILLSNNALLTDILVNNISLDGFSPQIFNYEYVLPFGTSQVPDLAYVKAEEFQIVDITKGFVNEHSYIYVTAEDGTTTNVYSVLFKVSGENPGDMPGVDDICLTYRGDGIWQASSRRNSVGIVIYSTGGALVYKSDVTVADPNDDLCSGSVGIQFRIPVKGVFVYSFIYNNKRIIDSKKAINR